MGTRTIITHLWRCSSSIGGRRTFSCSSVLATGMRTKLTAPNGQSWVQPLGLFINNEFVEGSAPNQIETLNP